MTKTYDMKQFSFDAKSKTLSSEMTTLEMKRGLLQEGYIFSIKGEQKTFDFRMDEKDVWHGEIAGWWFSPIDNACPVQHVLIIND